MPTEVIMPALELAQETGKVLRWLKSPGDPVRKGEPIVEIETDKVTTEIEAAASGVLREITAREGDVVPVGKAIALIATAEEAVTAAAASRVGAAVAAASTGAAIKASPLARRLAEQHGVDLGHIKTPSGRIEKADVLAHVESLKAAPAGNGSGARLTPASPKARRLAADRGVDLTAIRGTGPHGAVLAGDVPAQFAIRGIDVPVPDTIRAGDVLAGSGVRAGDVAAGAPPATGMPIAAAGAAAAEKPGLARPAEGVSTVWRIMADRMTASWTTAPHFYLVRDVNVSRLVAWRERASKQTGARITYTDLLVKLVAATIVRHPRVNASWKDGAITRNADVNIGLAVAVDDGLIVPVIHRADTLSIQEIAGRREDVVGRGQAGKLRPADIQGGGFTISNLGMYGVDAFSAIVNPPQAAILAVGRIADRVVALSGQPVVQPMMVLTLSCDHRAIDGARAAQFLGALADLIEEPLALLS